MLRLAVLLLILLATAIPSLAHEPGARATFIGNEGILIARGDTKVLFDAFYAKHAAYHVVSDETANAMMSGAAPYDGVDALFVSHVHRDHFAAEPVIDYMRAQLAVILYGPGQMREKFEEAGVGENDPLWDRIKMFDLAPAHDPISVNLGALHIEAVAVPHVGRSRDMQNLLWRITLDQATTVMHLGDADTVIADFERHKEYFAARKTNAAYPPYWFLEGENGRHILETYIDADQVTGIHVPAIYTGKGDELRAKTGGDVFTDPGESRDIHAPH